MKTELAVFNKKYNTVLNLRFGALYILFFIGSIFIKCFYYQFTTGLNSTPFFHSENLYMMAATLSIILIICGVILFCFNKGRYTALCATHFLLSALLTADTNFFRYYYGIITIPVLRHIDLRLLSSVDQSILSLFKIKDVIYLIDIPAAIAAMVKLNKSKPAPIGIKRRAAGAAALVAAGCLSFIPLYKRADVGSYFYNSNYVAKSLGVLYSHVDSIRVYLKEQLGADKLTEKESGEIEEFFDLRNTNTGNKYSGIARGKNVIVVQAEALQQFVIGKKVEGKEITPNLNKLARENVYFDNFYYQVAGGNTSDAELLCNTSMYPARQGAAYYRYADNTYASLPKTVKELGYNTYVLHAFRADFYNRLQMYETLGFDNYINGDDYVMDEFAGWDGEALSDSSFFRQSIDKLDTAKPFYSFFITLSSHHPFTFFEDFSFDTGKYEGTYLGTYLKAANYADKCLGQFLEALEKKGLYDSSLIVIYGDHSAVPKHMASELMEFLGLRYSELEWLKLQKVPLIISCKGLGAQKPDTVGGEIDIFPTIANLLGVDAPYAFGKDLLNTDGGYVILRDGSVITSDFVYMNFRREVYDTATGVRQSAGRYKESLNKLLYELQLSDLILEKDGFNSFED